LSVSIPVVDDEPDVAELFRQRFRERRARAPMSSILQDPVRQRWSNGDRDRARSEIVILSDINMPRNGWAGAAAGSQGWRPDLPVMMVTAYGDDERRRGPLVSMARLEFITKPVDFDVLKERFTPAAGQMA